MKNFTVQQLEDYDEMGAGVFCAYTKEDSIKMVLDRHKDFNGVTPTLIGKIITGCEDCNLGEIITDFHAG